MTPIPGVAFLDHTADVGIDVRAPTLQDLFHRAALGMLALLRGEDDEPPAPERPAPSAAAVSIAGEGHGREAVLAAWLREVLFLHEIDGRDYDSADFERLDDSGFRARVRTRPSSGAVREIKGVTYHELGVERVGAEWKGRVIFDV